MRTSFNGVPVHEVAHKVACGEYALLVAHFPDGVAYAIVSMRGEIACVEAVEGRGGTTLTSMIVEAARRAGLRCEAWVFNKARARLAARAGMFLTGEARVSASGKTQLQVQT
jgi:hypothetical protein